MTFLKIYPTELELKVEHRETMQFSQRCIFLSVKVNSFIRCLTNRMLVTIILLHYYYIVTVPLITSNITSVIVYSSTVTEFVRIARLILLLKGYLRYKTILCHKVALDV